ncbi:MAG: DUF6547 family protein [Erythrobacter sp.]
MSAYRDLMDHMVSLARGCVLANRIRAHGHAERSNEAALPLSAEEAERKRVLQGMTAEQRTIVADLLAEERAGAIHDVLANLPAHDVRLEGVPLAELADEVPHWDFMARLEERPWRKDD